MKKITIALAVLAALAIATAISAAAPAPVPLAIINIGTGDGLDGGGMEWGEVEPTYSGGSYGNCVSLCRGGTSRVVYGPLNWPAGTIADDTPYAFVNFSWDPEMGKARHIMLSVLDGIADDSFNVYIKNPGGEWVLVYHYDSDPSTSEYWVTHHIYSFPAGKGQGAEIDMKIEALGGPWGGLDQYGQLAVDWIEVWTH